MRRAGACGAGRVVRALRRPRRPRARPRTSRSAWRTSGCCSPSHDQAAGAIAAMGGRRASTSCASTRAGSTSRRGATRMHRPRGFDAGQPPLAPLQLGRRSTGAIDLTRAAGMRVMLSVTGPGPLWTSRDPRQRNPRYKPNPRAVRGVRARRGDALRRPRRPLPDLERAQHRGLAGAAADVRGAARLHPGLAAHLPLPRARRAAGDRARRPGRAGAARRARAARAPGDLDAHADLAAAVPARAGVRGPALQADAQRPLPRLPGPRGRTPSATTRTASSSAPRTRTRTATRPRSATCRGCSRRSTG